MKLELKNLILVTYGDREMWGTSKERKPDGIYNLIKNEEIRDDTIITVDSSTRSAGVPLLKETTKVPTLMMQKVSVGHHTFLIDPPTKTWEKLLKMWENKGLKERMVIQIYTLSGKEAAFVEITSMYKTSYPGKPIRVSLKLIVWL